MRSASAVLRAHASRVGVRLSVAPRADLVAAVLVADTVMRVSGASRFAAAAAYGDPHLTAAAAVTNRAGGDAARHGPYLPPDRCELPLPHDARVIGHWPAANDYLTMAGRLTGTDEEFGFLLGQAAVDLCTGGDDTEYAALAAAIYDGSGVTEGQPDPTVRPTARDD